MTSGIFALNWENVKSALVTTVLMALLAVALYIISLGDVWLIDWRSITNIGAMAFLAGMVSLIQSFLTSDKGKFAGMTQVE